MPIPQDLSTGIPMPDLRGAFEDIRRRWGTVEKNILREPPKISIQEASRISLEGQKKAARAATIDLPKTIAGASPAVNIYALIRSSLAKDPEVKARIAGNQLKNIESFGNLANEVMKDMFGGRIVSAIEGGALPRKGEGWLESGTKGFLAPETIPLGHLGGEIVRQTPVKNPLVAGALGTMLEFISYDFAMGNLTKRLSTTMKQSRIGAIEKEINNFVEQATPTVKQGLEKQGRFPVGWDEADKVGKTKEFLNRTVAEYVTRNKDAQRRVLGNASTRIGKFRSLLSEAGEFHLGRGNKALAKGKITKGMLRDWLEAAFSGNTDAVGLLKQYSAVQPEEFTRQMVQSGWEQDDLTDLFTQFEPEQGLLKGKLISPQAQNINQKLFGPEEPTEIIAKQKKQRPSLPGSVEKKVGKIIGETAKEPDFYTEEGTPPFSLGLEGESPALDITRLTTPERVDEAITKLEDIDFKTKNKTPQMNENISTLYNMLEQHKLKLSGAGMPEIVQPGAVPQGKQGIAEADASLKAEAKKYKTAEEFVGIKTVGLNEKSNVAPALKTSDGKIYTGTDHGDILNKLVDEGIIDEADLGKTGTISGWRIKGTKDFIDEKYLMYTPGKEKAPTILEGYKSHLTALWHEAQNIKRSKLSENQKVIREFRANVGAIDPKKLSGYSVQDFREFGLGHKLRKGGRALDDLAYSLRSEERRV